MYIIRTCVVKGGAAEFRVMPVPRDLYGELDISQLVATIRLPSGIEEPCGLAKVPGGYLGTYSYLYNVLSHTPYNTVLYFTYFTLLSVCTLDRLID